MLLFSDAAFISTFILAPHRTGAPKKNRMNTTCYGLAAPGHVFLTEYRSSSAGAPGAGRGGPEVIAAVAPVVDVEAMGFRRQAMSIATSGCRPP